MTWNAEYGMRDGDLKCGICKEGFGNWNEENGLRKWGFGMWTIE